MKLASNIITFPTSVYEGSGRFLALDGGQSLISHKTINSAPIPPLKNEGYFPRKRRKER